MRDWVLLVLAILMLFVGYFLQKMGIFDENGAGSMDAAVFVSDCDLRLGGCEIETSGQKLTFAIDPQDIQVLHPLKISADLHGNVDNLPERVSVEFEGVNMDMGYNRFALELSESGLFVAQAMLPACTAETMHWLIHLYVEKAGTISDFQFRLVTKNH